MRGKRKGGTIEKSKTKEKRKQRTMFRFLPIRLNGRVTKAVADRDVKTETTTTEEGEPITPEAYYSNQASFPPFFFVSFKHKSIFYIYMLVCLYTRYYIYVSGICLLS